MVLRMIHSFPFSFVFLAFIPFMYSTEKDSIFLFYSRAQFHKRHIIVSVLQFFFKGQVILSFLVISGYL